MKIIRGLLSIISDISSTISEMGLKIRFGKKPSGEQVRNVIYIELLIDFHAWKLFSSTPAEPGGSAFSNETKPITG